MPDQLVEHLPVSQTEQEHVAHDVEETQRCYDCGEMLFVCRCMPGEG